MVSAGSSGSPLPSTLSVMTGAASGVSGAVVSRTALAVTVGETLPAVSSILTETSNAAPSSGAGISTPTLPASISSLVKTFSTPLTITV